MRMLKTAFFLAIMTVLSMTRSIAGASEIKGWTALTTDGPSGPVTAAVFKNTIYVYPTRTWMWDYHDSDNFVYKSSDGAHWTKSTPPWAIRNVRLVVYREMLWAITSLGVGSNPGLEIWQTSDGSNWTKLASKTPAGRDGFAVAVFQDKLWLAGGADYPDDGNYSSDLVHPVINDVWNTDDGTSWSLVATGNAVAWEPRSNHVLITFRNKLWVLGGNNESMAGLTSCYSSSDGKNWTRETDLSGNGRGQLSANVLDNALYVFGGEGVVEFDPYLYASGAYWYSHTTPSVISSTDGTHWIEIASFGKIQDHASVVLNGRIFILGGWYWGDDEYLDWNSTVWASPIPGYDAIAPASYISADLPHRTGQTVSIDMINSCSLPWTSSNGFALKVITDNSHVTTTSTLPIAAGITVEPGEKYRFTLPVDLSKFFGAAAYVDVQMYQPDAGQFGDIVRVGVAAPIEHNIGWHKIDTQPPLPLAQYKNAVWLTADKNLWMVNWKSLDGSDWIRTSSIAGEPWKYGSDGAGDLICFKNKLIAPGSHDVWSSSDGMSWSRSSAQWTNYEGSSPDVSSSCILGDKLYVMITFHIYGVYGNYDYECRNEVWSTSDGTSWMKMGTLNGANFGSMVAFKDKLWVFGGIKSGYVEVAPYEHPIFKSWAIDPIYSSSDGKTWTLAGHLPWATRLTGIAAYRGGLWAADGATGMYSSDGINWEPATSIASHDDFQVFDDRLWSISKTGGLWCGSADAQSAMLSRSALDFGRCEMLAASGPKQNVGVYNLGIAPLGFTGVGAEIVSSRPGEFTFSSTPNTSPVSVGGTRTISIQFQPSRTGPTSATLRVTTNDPKHPTLTVKLTGEGVATQPFKSDSILAYILGKSNDATGLDKNSDSRINIADYVFLQNSPIQVTSPGSATQIKPGTSFRIKWKTTTQISNVKISLAHNHISVMTLKKSTANDGSTTCAVPVTLIPDNNYSIMISDAAHPSVQGESQWFKIVNPTPAITVEYPRGGETFSRGQKIPIGWTQTRPFNVRVEIYKDDTPYTSLITSTSGDIHYWTIPSDFATGDNYRVVVIDAGDANNRAAGAGVFSITP